MNSYFTKQFRKRGHIKQEVGSGLTNAPSPQDRAGVVSPARLA